MLITEAEYEALPAEVCKSIEVVDGRVIFCASPTPAHQRVSRNLTMALLLARPPSPCIEVLYETDMRFRHRNPHVVRAGKERAEYAAQGIPVYLIVVMSGSEIDSIAEYRLDWSGRNYQLVTVHRRSLTTEVPEGMKLDVSFQQLEQV
jgi:Uma2 family endonuclease